MTLDLSDLASVRKFALDFKEKHSSLDILINNAGITDTSGIRSETTDGFEVHMGVNHLGPFLLTQSLLPALKKAPCGK
jgi:retinol dehydrogenase-14